MRTHVGVISDTHGILRPEAVRILAGVDFILHAGDVGNLAILESLGQIAPVTAVRGNVDSGPWADALPLADVLDVQSCSLYVLHDLARIDLNPRASGFHAVIFGHSHVPAAEYRNGVLFLNPGSAGPRRFNLPVSLAILTIEGDRVSHELVTLDVAGNR